MNIRSEYLAVFGTFFVLGSAVGNASEQMVGEDGKNNAVHLSEKMAAIHNGFVDQCRKDYECWKRNGERLERIRFEIPKYKEGTLNSQKILARKLGVTLEEDG